MPLYDFHTHSFFSDGALLPMELIRRAHVNGYTAMAITDHASASNIEELVEKVTRDCDLAWEQWGFRVLPGVELTHCPPRSIAGLAARAKRAGAKIVVIHGETLVEPVPPGTNRASVECPDVDVLGHPGLLTEEEAALAVENNVFSRDHVASGALPRQRQHGRAGPGGGGEVFDQFRHTFAGRPAHGSLRENRGAGGGADGV